MWANKEEGNRGPDSLVGPCPIFMRWGWAIWESASGPHLAPLSEPCVRGNLYTALAESILLVLETGNLALRPISQLLASGSNPTGDADMRKCDPNQPGGTIPRDTQAPVRISTRDERMGLGSGLRSSLDPIRSDPEPSSLQSILGFGLARARITKR